MPRSTSTARPTGQVLLPLRLFLGFTFVYAGLTKFFSGDYWSATATDGFVHQTQSATATSPIGFLLNHALEHATLAAFGIAAGELLAGLGLLLGVWTRLSAAGAFALSTSFFLTVSWGTSPYFTGADIVFMAALLPLIIAGDAGYFSVGETIRTGVLDQMGVAKSRKLSNRPLEEEISRRTLVKTGAVAGGAGAAALALGLFGKSRAHASTVAAPADTGIPAATASATPTPAATQQAPAGTRVAAVSDLPVGGSVRFTASTGEPAYLLQPTAGTYLAYSAVCTHQGCTINHTKGSQELKCPCHGARFDTTSGEPTRGPARSPLTKFTVTVSGTDIYVA